MTDGAGATTAAAAVDESAMATLAGVAPGRGGSDGTDGPSPSPAPPPPPDPAGEVSATILLEPNHSFPEARIGRTSEVVVEIQAVRAVILDRSLLVRYGTTEEFSYPIAERDGKLKAVFRFPKSGDVSLVARVKWRQGSLSQVDESEPVAATVQPTNRKPLATVNVDGQTASPQAPPSLRVPPGNPTSFRVEVFPDEGLAPSSTQAVDVGLRFDGVDQGWRPLKSVPDLPFSMFAANDALVLREAMAPRPFAGKPGLVVVVRDTDFFGVASLTEFSVRTIDYSAPAISVTVPVEDQVIVLDPNQTLSDATPLIVHISGTAIDSQSGINAAGLTYAFGGKSGKIQVNNGSFSQDVSVTALGAYSVSLTATDQSPNGPNGGGNTATLVRSFSVVKVDKPTTYDELLGPRAYLAELLRFATSHVVQLPVVGVPQFVSSAILKQTFGRDFGALQDRATLGADAPESNLLVPMRLLRALPADQELVPGSGKTLGQFAGPATLRYHRTAYESVLRGIGTSFEELRGLAQMTQIQRDALAARVGLQSADLPALWPTGSSVRPGAPAFDAWLAAIFGIERTDPGAEARAPTPQLVQLQRSVLTSRWHDEDRGQQQPDLDPDLVDADDLNPDPPAWRTRLAARAADLGDKFATLQAAPSARAMIGIVWNQAQIGTLQKIASDEAAGKDITADLAGFEPPMGLPMFRRIIGYLADAGQAGGSMPLSQMEQDDLAHLLTQAWKLRDRYKVWLQEELFDAGTERLWPTATARAVWAPGHRRSRFDPWRGSAAGRLQIEQRMARRSNDWQTVADDAARAALGADQSALRELRDGLIGSLTPEQLRVLDERWLVDFGVNGVLVTTPILEATACLQQLLNGVFAQSFAQEHPAGKWQIYLRDGKDEEVRTIWYWLSSYASWRAGVLNYLYPENNLYPELMFPGPKPTDDRGGYMFQPLVDFLRTLAALMPLSTTKLSAIQARTAAPQGSEDALQKIEDSNEKSFFAWLAIGLAYQRSGLYQHALGVYQEHLFDWTRSQAADRTKVDWLRWEAANKPPAPDFSTDPHWTRQLYNPHAVARPSYQIRWGNPYTKFVAFQILECIVAQADQAFATGTRDGRAQAMALYLEAQRVLQLPELAIKDAMQPWQVSLPSPVLQAWRDRVAVALQKMRSGLGYLGLPMPTDEALPATLATIGAQVRPAPYRFRTLVERAKQLVSLTQQFEGQYLSAIERSESAMEAIMRETGGLNIANMTVDLRRRGQDEADDAMVLANSQLQRSDIQTQHFRDLLATGPSASERKQLDWIGLTNTYRQIANAAQTTAAIAQTVASSISIAKQIDSAGAGWALGTIQVAAQATAGTFQGLAINSEAESQLAGLNASYERRQQEWQYQLDLSNQDSTIGGDQVKIARDRFEIANQEYTIASAQADLADQMVRYLKTGKFANSSFYQWLSAVLADIYASFLRMASATARQAELQLAFERQEPPAGLIRPDYWQLSNSGTAAAPESSGSSGSSGSAGAGNVVDRRGMSASARLAQDLYELDQRAFTTDRRALNLTQTFSLQRLMPEALGALRTTGRLVFATPMSWFDEAFPGHYLRLIKRVRVSVAALISPSLGIRATLSNSGITRIVTGETGFPTVVLRQDPELVALTSPTSATGVFDLDMQSDLLFPFEGIGVDGMWALELPKAANGFDFDTLADVVISIDYTARFSSELRDQVIKTLPTMSSGVRSYSVKRDLPDVWYEISNGEGTSFTVPISLGRRAFPVGMTNVQIKHLAASATAENGDPIDFACTLEVDWERKSAGPSEPVPSLEGVASSRRTTGASWARLLAGLPALDASNLRFSLAFSDAANSTEKMTSSLRAGTVSDILIHFTVEGSRPAWT